MSFSFYSSTNYIYNQKNFYLVLLKQKIRKILLFYLLFFSLNLSISCLLYNSNEKIIILPLIKRNNTYLSHITNITNIIQFISLEQPIAELSIGSNKQKVNAIIRPGQSNIYLTSKNHTSNYYHEFTILKEKYENINYFDNGKSESIEYNKTYIKSYYFNNFKDWKIVFDDFEDIKLNFNLATSIQFEEPGSLGLQIEEKISSVQYTPSFLVQLKRNRIINNYKWFIYYGGEKEKDYIVFGCLPHEFIIPETGKKIFPNLDIDKDYYNVNNDLSINTRTMKIIFDDVYITSNITNLEKDNSFKENTYKTGILRFNLGCIIGSRNYLNYLENNFFKDYLYNKKCHNETFKLNSDFVSQLYYYFYCDDSVYLEIKKSFKPLVFKKVYLSENFILSFNDLFVKINGYLIFLIIFKNDTYSNYEWNLGAPFLRKYQFVYDFENKQIGYYHDRIKKASNGEDGINHEDKKNSNYISFGYFGFLCLIIILSIIFFILGFLFAKKIYDIRKKRAYELNGDYDYKEKAIN